MLPERLKPLVDALIAKTKNGKAIWQRIAVRDQYILNLEKTSVLIRKKSDGYGIPVESYIQDRPSTYNFHILDEIGQSLDSYEGRYSEEPELNELFELAQNSEEKQTGGKQSVVINSMLEELNQKDLVGA